MKPRFLLLLSICASAACAENQQLPPVIDNSTYQPGVAQPARAPSNDAMIDLLERVEQMQSEMQGLRGQIEEQTHVIEELKRRQDNIYSDLDSRVQQLETGSGGKAAAPAATQSQTSEAQLVEPQAAPASESTQVQTPAEEPASQVEAAPQQVPAADTTQAPAELMPTDEKQLYQSAYAALKNNQYERAIEMLKKLTVDYPNGEYADNAYYWLGETYKIKRNFEPSREAYNYVLSNYPNSDKVPDAMLKLGFLEFEQHNADRARELFKAVISKYPGSSAATLAQNKLRMMDQR